MPSKLKKAIGAVKDRTSISLAKVNSSSNLEIAILRATTHDDIPTDECHICQILQLVSANKIHAARCARAIGKRIGRTRNWIVALKSLMLVLRIFQDGDPYFPREVLHAMKGGAKILNLSNFRDDSNSNSWDFTAFVRTFALYLEERLDCFLIGKLHQRYTRKKKEGSYSFQNSPTEPVIDIKPDFLLDRIVYWQQLLERAIATRPTGSAKMNRLVQISLHVVVKESFDLYKDISNGLAVILDNFYHLQCQACAIAFQICVKAAKQFEELSAFYLLCKAIAIGRDVEYPSVQTIPQELIEKLQRFLKDQLSFSTPADKPFGSSQDDAREPKSDMGQGFTARPIEDLISETESGKAPSISIDLEAYSDKKSQQEEPFRVSYTGSTQSLPVNNSMNNSMMDLLSLDDWPQEEEQKEQQEKEGEQDLLESILLTNSSKDSRQSSSDNNLCTCSGKEWEHVLIESVKLSSHARGNSFNDFTNPQAQHGFDTLSERKESKPKKGWEFVLPRAATPQRSAQGISSNSFNASTTMTDSMHQAPSMTPSQQQTNQGVSLNTFDASSAMTPLMHQTPSMAPTWQPTDQGISSNTSDASIAMTPSMTPTRQQTSQGISSNTFDVSTAMTPSMTHTRQQPNQSISSNIVDASTTITLSMHQTPSMMPTQQQTNQDVSSITFDTSTTMTPSMHQTPSMTPIRQETSQGISSNTFDTSTAMTPLMMHIQQQTSQDISPNTFDTSIGMTPLMMPTQQQTSQGISPNTFDATTTMTPLMHQTPSMTPTQQQTSQGISSKTFDASTAMTPSIHQTPLMTPTQQLTSQGISSKTFDVSTVTTHSMTPTCQQTSQDISSNTFDASTTMTPLMKSTRQQTGKGISLNTFEASTVMTPSMTPTQQQTSQGISSNTFEASTAMTLSMYQTPSATPTRQQTNQGISSNTFESTMMTPSITHTQQTNQGISPNTSDASIAMKPSMTPTRQQTSQDNSSNTFDASTAMTLYNNPKPPLQPSNCYNPFFKNLPTMPISTLDFGASFPNGDLFSTLNTTTPSRNNSFSTTSHDSQNKLFTSHSSQNNLFAIGSLSSENHTFVASPNNQNDSFTTSTPTQDKQNDLFAIALNNNDNDTITSCSSKDAFDDTKNQQNLLQH